MIKCPDTGATLKWCPHHGMGAYMLADHNHKEWLEKKKRRQEKYKEQRAERAAKHAKFGDGDISKTPDKKVKDEKHPNKLQLSSAICQSLVTQCSMTPTEADTLLFLAFLSAMELDELGQGNN